MLLDTPASSAFTATTPDPTATTLAKPTQNTACGTAWLALAQRVLGYWHTYLPWLGGLTGLHVTRLQYTASQIQPALNLGLQ